MAITFKFNMFKISRPMLAYTALSAGFSIISSVFSFYYVKIFLERYRIPPAWFQIAQSLYMVWNAINDPLFAYMQDSVTFKFLQTRRGAVLYSAPLFALSFLVPWFPWEEEGKGTWVTGLHLIVSLALYDTFFTFVGLAACCLFTEISSGQNDRLDLVRISSVGSIIGSSVAVYSCEFFSGNLQNFGNFQITCVALAIFSCLLMRFTGHHAHTEFDKSANQSLTDTPSCDDSQSLSKATDYSMWQLTWHVLTNKNFVCFVIVNFFQEFHKTWMANFSVIITENLIPSTAISPQVRGTFHGLLNTIAPIMIVFGISVVRHFGSHRVIMWNFYMKISIGLYLYFLGGFSNPWILMLCMLLDRGCTGAAFSLFNMSLSDISYEDMQKYNRKHPISSMIFGTNALIVKPAISLSPMVVTVLLNSYGYHQLTDKSGEKMSPEAYSQLQGAMFCILCFLPVIVAVIQIVPWSQYALRNTHKPQSVIISS